MLAQGALPGVELIGLPGEDSRVDLVALLRILAERYDATNVMLECGPKLLGSFFAAGLVDEAFVYVAPRAERPVGLGASPDAPGSEVLRLFDLVRDKQLAGDVERWYRKRPG